MMDLLLAGFMGVLGLVIGWLAAIGWMRAKTMAAEAVVKEVREQMERLQSEHVGLRVKVEHAEKAQAIAETRSAETEKRLAAEKAPA
jgi:hypothetical protein